MFGRIQLTYWETLRGRAWILTRDLFGWNVKTGIVTAICFAAALVLYTWNRGSNEALDNLTVTLIYTVPFAAGGLATFVVNVLRAAQMIHEEQQEEIKRRVCNSSLRNQLPRRTRFRIQCAPCASRSW